MKIEQKLKIYAKEGYNVLLTGRHGVGKTAIIKEVFTECFGEHDVSWKYYSASTLDPWVDFIGIPKSYTRPDGKEVFKIIPPEHFSGDEEIQAIFFDEINRADEKTLNAVMELIQFKSINGRKFPHLKCVWAAENPADDADQSYSVQPLDPAQRDRFQIQMVVPEELNTSYFTSKFDKEVFSVASAWWAKNHTKVSPRRLDEMLTGHIRGFDLDDFSPHSTVRELTHSLISLSAYKDMKDVVATATVTPEDIQSYFTLDRLRKNEKIIKTDSSKIVLKKIFDHLDGETQAYIEKEFKFSTKKVITSVMTPTQEEFCKNRAKQANSKFNEINPDAFKDYVTVFNLCFTASSLSTDINYKLLIKDGFPFVYDNTFSTFGIRAFVTNMGSQNQEKVKHWFQASMFILANSKGTSSKSSSLYQVLVKLAGNREFIRYIGLNKIFFAQWKREYPKDDFLLYQKRATT